MKRNFGKCGMFATVRCSNASPGHPFRGSVLTVEAYPRSKDLDAEIGGHGCDFRAGVTVDFHAGSDGHLVELEYILVYGRAINPVRRDGGLVGVFLDQAAPFAVGTQHKAVGQGAGFRPEFLGHLFRDGLKLVELAVVNLEVHQYTNTSGAHGWLLET